MYTQCPDCQIAFRVTARVLQQAAGKVRCGNCGNAFSALDHLSEELPDSMPTGGAKGDDHDALAETSKKLLETLNELAGPENVRIEDTGVEWRVLSEADAAIADNNLTDTSDTGSIQLDEEIEETTGDDVLPTVHEDSNGPPETTFVERRYDDNTPLPEDYDDSDEYSPPLPQRRESDNWQESAMLDELQGDLALSEPGEWTDLLDEVSDADSIPPEVEEELVAIHNQLSSRDSGAPAEGTAEVAPVRVSATQSSVPVDLDTQFELQAEALGITGEQKVIDADDDRTLQDELTDEMPLLEGDFDDAAETEQPTAIQSIELSADSVSDEHDEDDDALEYDLSEEYEDDSENLQLYADGDADTQFGDDAQPQTEPGDGKEDGDHALALADDEDEEIVSHLVRAESSGEFEAQIDAAADALRQRSDDGGGADDSEPDTEAVDNAESNPDDDIFGQESEGTELLDDVEQISARGIEEPVIDLDVDGDSDSDSDDRPDEVEAVEVADENEDEGEEVSRKKLTDDQLAATVFGVDHASKFFDENSGEVETIIMEGEFIRSALEQERLAEELQAQANIEEASKLADTYAMNREKLRNSGRSFTPPSYLLLIGVILLGLGLVAQIVHASRDSLATTDFFKTTVAPVYRLLGNPITPQWDIKGWQFESTRGSTDDAEAALTIVSRIANYTDVPLPYPLVHISLTDRWEEIIGSRVLEPNEYLAGDIDPGRPVTPGEDFTAVITIENPSAEATGFKLNVCYRVIPGRVRCAIEDFKD